MCVYVYVLIALKAGNLTHQFKATTGKEDEESLKSFRSFTRSYTRKKSDRIEDYCNILILFAFIIIIIICYYLWDDSAQKFLILSDAFANNSESDKEWPHLSPFWNGETIINALALILKYVFASFLRSTITTITNRERLCTNNPA